MPVCVAQSSSRRGQCKAASSEFGVFSAPWRWLWCQHSQCWQIHRCLWWCCYKFPLAWCCYWQSPFALLHSLVAVWIFFPFHLREATVGSHNSESKTDMHWYVRRLSGDFSHITLRTTVTYTSVRCLQSECCKYCIVPVGLCENPHYWCHSCRILASSAEPSDQLPAWTGHDLWHGRWQLLWFHPIQLSLLFLYLRLCLLLHPLFYTDYVKKSKANAKDGPFCISGNEAQIKKHLGRSLAEMTTRCFFLASQLEALQNVSSVFCTDYCM